MFPLSKNQTTFFFLTLLTLGLLVGLYHDIDSATPKLVLSEGTLIPPRSISDFELIDEEARFFTKERLKNKWSVLFFGYTHCPSICPRTLQLMKEIKQFLGNEPVNFVLISADPEHDSPAQLRSYLKTIDPGFIGITGDSSHIYQLARELGIYVNILEKTENALEHLPHSGALLVLNPNADLVALFTAPRHARLIAEDLQSLIFAWQKSR